MSRRLSSVGVNEVDGRVRRWIVKSPIDVTNERVTQLEAEVNALKQQIVSLMARQTQIDALIDAGALCPHSSSSSSSSSARSDTVR